MSQLKKSPAQTDTSSKMSDFINELPEEVYAMADDITLSDLLSFPATRHWAFSLISNAATHPETLPQNMDEEERLMMHNILTINNSLPMEMRAACFSKCQKLVHQARELKRSKNNE